MLWQTRTFYEFGPFRVDARERRLLRDGELAEIYSALGQTEEAFEWLNKAYEQHDMQMVSLLTNPTLDSLRSDARFDGLVRRVGLPP